MQNSVPYCKRRFIELHRSAAVYHGKRLPLMALALWSDGVGLDGVGGNTSVRSVIATLANHPVELQQSPAGQLRLGLIPQLRKRRGETQADFEARDAAYQHEALSEVLRKLQLASYSTYSLRDRRGEPCFSADRNQDIQMNSIQTHRFRL